MDPFLMTLFMAYIFVNACAALYFFGGCNIKTEDR